MARDATTGKIVPDPTKFPSGMSNLTSQIHALGLKAGIYRYVSILSLLKTNNI